MGNEKTRRRHKMKRPASFVASILFLLMAAAQFVRFILDIPVTAAGLEIPVWPSVVAAVILAALAVWLFREQKGD
jgi:hypothetical protein